MKRNIRPRSLSGTVSADLQPWEMKHMSIAQEAAEEGIVLLKNDGTLPLAPGCRVALYGAGADHTIKGGTGSGDVNERHSVTIAEGLRTAGFHLTTETTNEKSSGRERVIRKITRKAPYIRKATLTGR